MSVSEGNWTVRLDGSTLPDRALIGGKGWSIARLCALGLPTSPAVTATTEACRAYMATGDLPAGLMDELRSGLDWIEQETGRIFGGAEKPLLISVRSGAPVSMPGMMDTVLNLGITDQAENALAVESGDAVFAHDTHRRFYELYASIVLKAALGELDAGQSTAEWREQVKAAAGTAIPESAEGQLEAAVRAVFDSWNSRRAKRYRAHNGIPDELGTAVSVQAMVFGNLDQNSGTGVLFSRNPLSGDPGPFGEYLSQAQGEDVVSGKVTPEPLSALASAHPDVHEELMKASDVLERENGDVQDIEFTVQQVGEKVTGRRGSVRGRLCE